MNWPTLLTERIDVRTLARTTGLGRARHQQSRSSEFGFNRWFSVKRGFRFALTHHRPRTDDTMLNALLADVRRDYSGPVVLGEDLTRIEV